MQNSPTNPEDVPRNVPRSIAAAVDTAVRAAQKYGDAVARKKPIHVLQKLMAEQKKAVKDALSLVDAELSRRYEGGIEVGRAQATMMQPKAALSEPGEAESEESGGK